MMRTSAGQTVVVRYFRRIVGDRHVFHLHGYCIVSLGAYMMGFVLFLGLQVFGDRNEVIKPFCPDGGRCSTILAVFL